MILLDEEKDEFTVDEKECLALLKHHYAKLATDTTGNSRAPEAWRHLDQDASTDGEQAWIVTNKALYDTIRRLGKHKATGPDGIPNEALRTAAHSPVKLLTAPHSPVQMPQRPHRRRY
jgi:hypothetical protein